jgi:hypothetical protein
MAFAIDDGKEREIMYKSDRRLYLTPDGNVSEEPVTGGTLLVGEGAEIPNEVAERHGLTGKQVAPPEDKARKEPKTKAADGESPA